MEETVKLAPETNHKSVVLLVACSLLFLSLVGNIVFIVLLATRPTHMPQKNVLNMSDQEVADLGKLIEHRNLAVFGLLEPKLKPYTYADYTLHMNPDNMASLAESAIIEVRRRKKLYTEKELEAMLDSVRWSIIFLAPETTEYYSDDR
jgi:hypothetical protein